jgi:hypothetical protein
MSRQCINPVDKQVMAETWCQSRTCLILLVVCIATNSFASGPAARSGVRVSSFEVVSVKPSNPCAQYSRLGFTADGYIAENASLLMIIRTAYGYSISSRDCRLACTGKCCMLYVVDPTRALDCRKWCPADERIRAGYPSHGAIIVGSANRSWADR